MSRWTVMDHERPTMPVAGAVADQAIEANEVVRVQLPRGWAVVVPDMKRAEERALGMSEPEEERWCVRDDGASVYVSFIPTTGMPFGAQELRRYR